MLRNLSCLWCGTDLGCMGQTKQHNNQITESMEVLEICSVVFGGVSIDSRDLICKFSSVVAVYTGSSLILNTSAETIH